MKPSQYIAIRNRIQDAIAELNESIEFVRDQVDDYPDESKLRQATAEDIVPGAVIWSRSGATGDWEWDGVERFVDVWVKVGDATYVHFNDAYVEDDK